MILSKEIVNRLCHLLMVSFPQGSVLTQPCAAVCLLCLFLSLTCNAAGLDLCCGSFHAVNLEHPNSQA